MKLHNPTSTPLSDKNHNNSHFFAKVEISNQFFYFQAGIGRYFLVFLGCHSFQPITDLQIRTNTVKQSCWDGVSFVLWHPQKWPFSFTNPQIHHYIPISFTKFNIMLNKINLKQTFQSPHTNGQQRTYINHGVHAVAAEMMVAAGAAEICHFCRCHQNFRCRHHPFRRRCMAVSFAVALNHHCYRCRCRHCCH